MTGITDLCHPETVRVAAAHQAEAEKIAAELAAIARSGMVLPGSITQRRTRCGRANCGCHADPPRLHGPYWQWTRKIAAKTVCRWLSTDQHRDYAPWIDNDRRLRDLLARLEALGAAAFENAALGRAFCWTRACACWGTRPVAVVLAGPGL